MGTLVLGIAAAYHAGMPRHVLSFLLAAAEPPVLAAPVLAGTKDPAAVVRKTAAELLAGIGLPAGEAVPLLITALDDSDPGVRRAAVTMVDALAELAADAGKILPALEVSARRLRTLVACGAASAIAATFNAPIAGAMFSIEVVLGDLTVSHLSPIVISSVVATVVSRHYLGDFPAFEVPAYEAVHPGELLLYAGLGLAAGVMAVIFIRLMSLSTDLFERSTAPPWLRPAIGGLAVGVISLWLPHVYGVGYETINAALWGRTSGLLLLLLVCAKAGATALTLGSGGSGGVFAPSLFMGASLGAAWGHLVHGMFPGWTAAPGAYALVGMGAMVSATTHGPITAILIIFELTNDYRIIPALMLACVIGVLLSGLLHRESIYTFKLARRGVRLSLGRDASMLRSIRVSEVMSTDPDTVSSGMPLPQLIPRLLTDPDNELLVVDSSGRLLGTVCLADVRTVLEDMELLADLAVAADAVHERVPFVLPNDHLDLVMHYLGRTHRDSIPVCADKESRRVVGVVTQDNVIDTYNRRLFQLDLAGGFGSLVEAVRGGTTVEVAGGIHLGEVDVPHSLVGKTLSETDLRRRYGTEVVLIRTGDESAGELEGRPGKLPAADTRLEAGDQLLVMGTLRAIRNLQEGLADDETMA